MALLRASTSVKSGGDLTHDEKVGYEIVVRACRSPLKQIIENAGEDGNIVAARVLEEKNVNYGFDARLGKYCDLVKEGKASGPAYRKHVQTVIRNSYRSDYRRMMPIVDPENWTTG